MKINRNTDFNKIMNIVKAIIFANLENWPEHKNGVSMDIESAIKVDCVALRWSMAEFCYKPLGITRSRISNFNSQQGRIHNIMVANVYNCFHGFISEILFNEMCATMLKPGEQKLVYLEPVKTSLHESCGKLIRETTEKCANRHLRSGKRLTMLNLEDLTYDPDNVQFLSHLYQMITEWPAQYCKDLMTSVQNMSKTVLEDCTNLSFLIFLQRLISVYSNFVQIKVNYVPEKRRCQQYHQPKCYGPNNSLKAQFKEASTIRVCALCYTITNLYISKSYNKTKVYSDMLLKEHIYTCSEKTCKYFTVDLIFIDCFRNVYYPEISFIVNKSSTYTVRMKRYK